MTLDNEVEIVLVAVQILPYHFATGAGRPLSALVIEVEVVPLTKGFQLRLDYGFHQTADELSELVRG